MRTENRWMATSAALLAGLFVAQAQVQVTLPAPMVQETFDGVAEGELPPGWTVRNFTDSLGVEPDLSAPNSDSYLDWVVISRQRVLDIGAAGGWDAPRRLNVAPNQFVNGQPVTSLVEGNFIYAESDVRGGSQVQYLFTPDFNLVGKTNVYLFYHSIYEQNQDSIGAVEYSIDGGQTWLPIIYMVDQADIIRDSEGNLDAVATLTEPRGDAAVYVDPVSGETIGGFYGAFIGAEITGALAPFVSGRVNDDATESKRVELFRLPAADNQAKVRFRFAQAGTGSWYFGIDNFGLYSIEPPSQRPNRPTLTVQTPVRFLGQITLTGSAFTAPGANEVHSLTVWQVSAAPAFSAADGLANVLESIATTNALTTLSAKLNFIHPGGVYFASVQYWDQAGAKSDFAEPVAFTVEPLPAPIAFEDFESVAEGEGPAGWTLTNESDGNAGFFDLLDPNSDSYMNWTVVAFETLGVLGGPRLTVTNVVNGKTLYAESDNRGGNQIQFAVTPDYNLTGKANVWVAFRSNYEQNQDSLGVLEYSIDGGANWLPVVYLIDRDDLLRNLDGTVDVLATLTTTYGDVAKIYLDPSTGERVAAGKYEDFILARPLEALGPFLSGRINDHTTESKRYERFRLAAADGQSRVRLRFVQAGTGSWFWGIDDLGLYEGAPESVAPSIGTPPLSQTVWAGASVNLSVLAGGTEPLSYQWKLNGNEVPGATSPTLVLTNVQPSAAGQYTVVVSNAAGSAASDPAVLTVRLAPLGAVTGQWDFDRGDLSATVGLPLEFRGDTGAGTVFGTMMIDGQEAKVMQFPATSPAQGYIMRPDTAPNGGGAFINQYTLIMDIMFPAGSSGKWRALFQTNPNNSNDGDLFVNTANGIGISGQYQGQVLADTWHRVAFAFDLTTSTVGKYLDGQLVNLQTLGSGKDGRWSLGDIALLFADEDGETATGYVNSIQFRSGRMSDAEIAALGRATAGGIPLPSVTGQWDFDRGDLLATVGLPLEFRGDTGAGTAFGTATIGGQEAKVMQFPATTPAQGYVMRHAARPNGGGAFVNRYTLVMDIMFPAASSGKWRALFQTNPNNSNDGDLFVNTGNGIGISGQYQGQVLADTWHRVAFAFDLTTSTVGKYVDGQLVNLQTLSSGADGRWSLGDIALLFADEDGETATGYVNSIQFHNRRLSDAEIAALGAATAAGIPTVIPLAPPLEITSIELSGDDVVIKWAGGPGLRLQVTPSLRNPNWQDVAGSEAQSLVTWPLAGDMAFFRLVK